MLSPSHIFNIAHPNVTAAFIKQDLHASTNGAQVLVLETDISGEEDDKYFDLLVDLGDIRSQAEMMFGDIARVDIRSTCH